MGCNDGADSCAPQGALADGVFLPSPASGAPAFLWPHTSQPCSCPPSPRSEDLVTTVGSPDTPGARPHVRMLNSFTPADSALPHKAHGQVLDESILGGRGYRCCVYGPAVFLSTELSGSVLYSASQSCVCARARTRHTRLLSVCGSPLFSHWGPFILTKAPSSLCSSAGLVSLVRMKTLCNPQSQRCPPVFSWGGSRASALHSEART